MTDTADQARRWLLDALAANEYAVPCTSDPEGWFPDKSARDAHARAVALCNTCPVGVECLEYAVREGQVEGIWGGTTKRERARMRARSSRTPAPQA